MTKLFALTVLWIFALAGAVGYQAKLESVLRSTAPAGSRVAFTTDELRQWLRDDVAYWAGYGVTNLRFTLGTGRATASANVDFLKAQKATTGQDANWLMRSLFSGQKAVTVTARFSSANGRGRVDVERVEVNGIPAEGAALRFLIQDIVKPNFPEARVSEWFPMEYRVERFTVAPSGIVVHIGK